MQKMSKKSAKTKKTQYDKYHLCAVCELNLLKNFAYFNWHSAAQQKLAASCLQANVGQLQRQQLHSKLQALNASAISTNAGVKDLQQYQYHYRQVLLSPSSSYTHFLNMSTIEKQLFYTDFSQRVASSVVDECVRAKDVCKYITINWVFFKNKICRSNVWKQKKFATYRKLEC